MQQGLREWQSLDEQEQLQLREAYGHYLDSLPPTCELGEKNRRFIEWLAKQGVRYP